MYINAIYYLRYVMVAFVLRRTPNRTCIVVEDVGGWSGGHGCYVLYKRALNLFVLEVARATRVE